MSSQLDERKLLPLVRKILLLEQKLRVLDASIPPFDINNENTPDPITSDQNDYAIGGFDVLRMSSNAARSITGFAEGKMGRLLLLINVGSFTITIPHQSGSSISANQVVTTDSSSFSLTSGLAVFLYYDSTASRWRILMSSGGGGGTSTGGSQSYPMQARLTLETGVPLSTSNQLAKTILYLTQYNGNKISLYDTGSSTWLDNDLGADISLSTAGLGRSQAYTNDPTAGSNIVLNMVNTAGFIVGNPVKVSSSAGSETAHITAVVANTSITVDVLALNHTTTNPLVTGRLPYDIFVYDNAGALTLEAVAWTNTATRATARAVQDGVFVQNGAANKRWIGTIKTTLTLGELEFSESQKSVWNHYNRKPLYLFCSDTTDSWNYTTAAFRPANANKIDGVGRVSCVIGHNDVKFRADNVNISQNTLTNKVACGGVGIDSITTTSAQIFGIVMGTAAAYVAHTAYYEGYPAVGGHWIQRLELSEAVGTTKWGGDVNSPGQILIGMVVEYEG